MKHIKKRFDQVLENPVEVKKVKGQGGRIITIRTTQRTMTPAETIAAMEKDRLEELKEMGFSLKKLQDAGFDPDRDNPDDFCGEEFGEE